MFDVFPLETEKNGRDREAFVQNVITVSVTLFVDSFTVLCLSVANEK